MAKFLMYLIPPQEEFVSLPVFGFGYFPLTKQYNVLSIYSEFMAAIITVGHSNIHRGGLFLSTSQRPTIFLITKHSVLMAIYTG